MTKNRKQSDGFKGLRPLSLLLVAVLLGTVTACTSPEIVGETKEIEEPEIDLSFLPGAWLESYEGWSLDTICTYSFTEDGIVNLYYYDFLTNQMRDEALEYSIVGHTIIYDGAILPTMRIRDKYFHFTRI